MASQSFDLVVIGGGPGGYVAAIRAAQLGQKVACVDLNPLLGGTCLRVGCIPSKALLESSERFAETQHALAEHGVRVAGVSLDLATMMGRKQAILKTLGQGVEGLFKRHKVTRFLGFGRLDGAGRVMVDQQGSQTLLEAGRIILATGSSSATLPGVELDGDRIGTSTEALSYEQVPAHLVVIGAGYIGMELASVWRRLGAKVTIVEFLDRILPGIDSDIAKEAHGIFKKQGLEFRLGNRVKRAYVNAGQAVVECENSEPISCDRVLLAVGRVPQTERLGLETAGVQCDPKGRITVNDAFETSAPKVYAIGDCIRGPMLAHKASDEGIACVERFLTGYGRVNYDAIPGVVYTHPEIASVGKTEDQLKEAGVKYRKGTFPFAASGRARAMGQLEGRVKVLADAVTDRILGVHIIGPHAGELIAEGVSAIEFGASSEDLARCCHAHPSLSEAVREASFAVRADGLHG